MADPNSRLGRETSNREASQRDQAWAPPTILPSPDPKEGWEFRWVRVSTMGQSDPTNVSSKFREGWEPCKAEDHPELHIHADTTPNSRFKDNIEIGGLLLCKMPVEKAKQRREYYENLARSQLDAVDNSFMRQKDARTNMELFTDRKSSVSFGRGNKT
jgi:hypothetical protein